jgi:hypothetical protein
MSSKFPPMRLDVYLDFTLEKLGAPPDLHIGISVYAIALAETIDGSSVTGKAEIFLDSCTTLRT